MDSSNPMTQVETRDEAFKDARSTFMYWDATLKIAKQDCKTWMEDAETAYDIYEAEKGKERAFNILHANTETILPSIYNSMPLPDVRTRHNDRDEAKRKTAQLLERATSYSLDEYDFDEVMELTLRDMVLTGRGVMRVAYDPLMRTVQAEDENGEVIERDEVAWQTAKCEYVAWDHFLCGKSDTWGAVPYIAFLKSFTRDELRELAGDDVADWVPLDMSDGDMKMDMSEEQKSTIKKAMVWEIWDRETRQLFYIAPGYTEGPIAVVDDPLGLLDFFPVPRPIFAIRKNKSLTPVVPYTIYKKQAAELNRVSERILGLVDVLRWRGIRASELTELEEIAGCDDGEFVASKSAMGILAQNRSLDDAIWTMPLERIIQVIRELASQRREIKETIYEITGIADVMRGATQASETLGAQQLKAQWGSLRVQKMQADVQRFVRDLLRLKSEIIASKFTVQTLTYINNEEIDPRVLEILRGDIQRVYAIDIETDSTIRGDMARSQQNMSQFLGGVANYAQSIGPLVQQNVIPKDLALTLFDSFARQFKLGKQLEDKLAEYIERAQQPDQDTNDPEKQKQKAQEDEARAINRQGAILKVQSQQLDNREKEIKIEGQQIENHNAIRGVSTTGFMNG